MPRTCLALVLLLASCATWPRGFLFMDKTFPVVCTTKCNLQLLGANPGEPPLPESWTCEAVQEVETRALIAFSKPDVILRDPRFRQACVALSGWEISVSALEKNLPTLEGSEGGETGCNQSRVFIGNSPPMLGRLGHELAHVVQRCQPFGDGRIYQNPHQDWEPIYSALEDAGFQRE